MPEFNGDCPICGERLNDWKYYCSERCVDISEGEGPRRPAGFFDVEDRRDQDRDPGGSGHWHPGGRNSGYGT